MASEMEQLKERIERCEKILEKDHDAVTRIEVSVENLCASVKKLYNIIWGFCSLVVTSVIVATIKLIMEH